MEIHPSILCMNVRININMAFVKATDANKQQQQNEWTWICIFSLKILILTQFNWPLIRQMREFVRQPQNW